MVRMVEAQTEITPKELVDLVDGLRGFVYERMRGHIDEVDPAMQEIRETVWRCGHRFDPDRGRPGDFVFGVARNVVWAVSSSVDIFLWVQAAVAV